MRQTMWADRGHLVQLADKEAGPWARCFGASRLGSVELSAQALSIWVQVRGNAWVEAREGRFYLRPGDWIALARDSRPVVQADRDGLCLGICIGDEAMKAMARFADFGLYVGRGRLRPEDVRPLSRLWYRAASHPASGDDRPRLSAPLRSLLLHLEALQDECRSRMHRCPGSSLARKRQVFERMQRARLFMEGNCNRMVRIGELAERTQFSVWYFSKVFHRLYDEGPLAASARLRLEHAANLLASTPLTIGEVSVASGFDNNCSFARSFRAHYGMTASDYRAAVHAQEPFAQTCGTSRAQHIAGNRDSIGYGLETDISLARIRLMGV
ncbi:MAG TPA: helix-turn-helix transcriptional regulator [Lysobacter sp.]